MATGVDGDLSGQGKNTQMSAHTHLSGCIARCRSTLPSFSDHGSGGSLSPDAVLRSMYELGH